MLTRDRSVVGAGTLAMPLAMSHMGILLGTFVILWSGLMAAFGLYLQSRCARYLDRGTASFFALSQITYPNAAVIFDAAIAIKCFGVGVSYLIIIGDLMPGVATGFDPEAVSVPILMDRKFWITIFMWVLEWDRSCDYAHCDIGSLSFHSHTWDVLIPWSILVLWLWSPLGIWWYLWYTTLSKGIPWPNEVPLEELSGRESFQLYKVSPWLSLLILATRT